MLRRTNLDYHRTGKARAFVFRDPSLRLLRAGTGARQLKRMGMSPQVGLGYRKVDNLNANAQYQHAWPLLSHDDLGNSDQSNNTRNIMYSMYMPKRNKGTAPWFRGADTYSVKYCEQGRYEYQRYLMINRFPSEYKKHFARFLGNIRGSRASGRPDSDPLRANSAVLPQETLHWLLRMIVDNFNPQHVHYIAAMQTLLEANEVDMARDVWKIMERQQTWPDTATLCAYLDVCAAAGEKTWAAEAWNRYGTELTFLAKGEVDPKPVTRTPFSLTREELLYLPKWKKHFDHDPNLDVPDLNRFNRTREVYLRMAKSMLAGGDDGLFQHFYSTLEEAMLTTPTPVPEPPNPHLVRRPRWAPYEHLPSAHASPWRVANNGRVMALGPCHTDENAMQSRFFSNEQFLVHSASEVISAALQRYQAQCPEATGCAAAHALDKAFLDAAAGSAEAKAVLALCDDLVERLFTKLGEHMGNLETSTLLSTILAVHRVAGKEGGAQLHTRAVAFQQRKQTATKAPARESLTAPNYLQVLTGFADESAFFFDRSTNTNVYRTGFDARAVIKAMSAVLQEMADNVHVAWSADMHLQVVRALVNCGTMQANDYFVKNVLRQYPWDSAFLESLYMEYRRHDDATLWAELTKRALVWTARYDVNASEKLKRLIEDDYDVIGVQTRTFRELAVFQFRDAEEKRQARNVVNELPNPWMDYVSHALPFPDRDAGYPDEYGDIGQWRAPGGPGSPVKGPGYYAPPMEGEHQRGYTAEWRDLKNPMRPPEFPTPWERKYKQYARGQHPSYDMVYAGPMPEIFPGRHDFRKPTRWDYQDIEKQGKFKISGPY